MVNAFKFQNYLNYSQIVFKCHQNALKIHQMFWNCNKCFENLSTCFKFNQNTLNLIQKAFNWNINSRSMSCAPKAFISWVERPFIFSTLLSALFLSYLKSGDRPRGELKNYEVFHSRYKCFRSAKHWSRIFLSAEGFLNRIHVLFPLLLL